ncbi:MAG: hypothetical protein JNM89_01315 [Hyphomicrobiaceae bacterium]|nr:hypothetical protein [Hyphomicrobiaceae bacterium]
MSIDFDASKTGNYNLLVDNFHNDGTGTVYIHAVGAAPQPQQYMIDWAKVAQNASDAVSYGVDTDNNGSYETISNFSSVLEDIVAPTTVATLA